MCRNSAALPPNFNFDVLDAPVGWGTHVAQRKRASPWSDAAERCFWPLDPEQTRICALGYAADAGDDASSDGDAMCVATASATTATTRRRNIAADDDDDDGRLWNNPAFAACMSRRRRASNDAHHRPPPLGARATRPSPVGRSPHRRGRRESVVRRGTSAARGPRRA